MIDEMLFLTSKDLPIYEMDLSEVGVTVSCLCYYISG